MPALQFIHHRITVIVFLLVAIAASTAPAWAAVPAEPTQTPITGSPSISPATVQRIVAGTPLAPYADTIFQAGQQSQIDPAFALAIWTNEGSLDTAGASVANNNPGNLICAAAAHPPATSCSGRWATYPDLGAAVTDWYRYINARYAQQGLTTVETILRVYAPAFENDTEGYIGRVNQIMAQWRGQSEGWVAPPATAPVSVNGVAATAPATPLLRCGATGPAVADLQSRLNGWITATPRAGLKKLAEDGIYGPRTTAAVWAYQKAHGLLIDGITGPQTWGSVLTGSGTAPAGLTAKALRAPAGLCRM